MEDEKAIRELIDQRVEAMRAGDAATFCGTYAPDSVVYSLAPPLVQPPDGSRDVASMQAWLDGKGGSVWSEVRDLEITVDGDLAVCTSVERMGTGPDSPQPFSLWFRSTLALRRVDGRWQIFHDHASTPFYMDGSMRAAVDLEP